MLLPAVLFFSLTALTNAGLALAAWLRRSEPAMLAFGVYLGGQTLWCLLHVAEIVSDSLTSRIVWDSLQLWPMLVAGSGLLVFALELSGVRLRPTWIAWSALFASGPSLWYATSPWHG